MTEYVVTFVLRVFQTSIICSLDGCAAASILFVLFARKRDRARLIRQWPIAIALGHITFAGLTWTALFLAANFALYLGVAPQTVSRIAHFVPVIGFGYLGYLLASTALSGETESFGDSIPKTFFAMFILACAFSADAAAWGIAIFGLLAEYSWQWHVAGIFLAGGFLWAMTALACLLASFERVRELVRSDAAMQGIAWFGCLLLAIYIFHIFAEALPEGYWSLYAALTVLAVFCFAYRESKLIASDTAEAIAQEFEKPDSL